jgi:hypothetical protein
VHGAAAKRVRMTYETDAAHDSSRLLQYRFQVSVRRGYLNVSLRVHNQREIVGSAAVYRKRAFDISFRGKSGREKIRTFARVRGILLVNFGPLAVLKLAAPEKRRTLLQSTSNSFDGLIFQHFCRLNIGNPYISIF